MKARYILILLAMLAVVGCKEENEKDAKGVIHGLITDLETGELIENARVTLHTGLSVVTDQTGAYRFDNLSPDTYAVIARKVGYPDSTRSENVPLKGGQTLQVDLQLDKKNTKLSLLTAEDKPLTQLYFGTDETGSSRSFTLVNESRKRSVKWSIGNSIPWIRKVFPNEGVLNPEGRISIIVTIDKSELPGGIANGMLHVLSEQGNLEIKVMAVGRITQPEVKIRGCEAISDESAFATLKVEEWGSQLIKSFGMQVIYPNETEWRNVSATLSTHVKTYFATIPTGASAPLGSVLRVRPYAADADGNVLWSGEEMNVPIEKHAPVVKLAAGDNGAQGGYSVEWRMEQLGYPAAERIVVNVSDTREKAYTGVPDISWTAISQLLKYGHIGTTLELKPSGGEVLKPETTYYISFQLEGAELGSVKSDVLEHNGKNPDWHTMKSLRLMVQRKDLGSGTWSVADGMCKGSSLGGFDNWRLPTKKELAAIYGEKEAIGGFEENGYYWTSEVRKGYNEPYGAIAFSEGYFLYRVEAARSYVRAVRSY